MPLPIPRLTATITPGAHPGQLGRVEVHGLARIARVPRRSHRCSACGELGHNAANRRCPGPAHVIAIDAETMATDNYGQRYSVHGTRWRWRCSCGDNGLYVPTVRAACSGGARHVAAMERGR